MFRRQRQDRTISTDEVRAFADFHAWVLSLPWVVERPSNRETPGVRCFGVDCKPLRRRQLWMMTGLDREGRAGGLGLAVIVPRNAANDIEESGWGRPMAPMPRRHMLVAVDGAAFDRPRDAEALVLAAYGYALS